MKPRLNKSRTFTKVRDKSVTLIELLITIALLSVIVLGFASIDLFSRSHVISSDRRAQTQNDLSYVLEHMSKEINKAIGDINNVPVVIDDSYRRIKVYIDYNQDGQRSTGDCWIAYRYRDSSAPAGQQYQIWYCPQCIDSTCDVCTPDDWNSTNFINKGYLLSKKITDTPSFTYSPSNDYVEVKVTTCWDPTKTKTTADCGTSSDNPSVTMQSRIKMPSVSTH